MTATNGTSAMTPAHFAADEYAMPAAATRKIHGANEVMRSPNGDRIHANSTAAGIAMNAEMTAPEIALRSARCGRPSARIFAASSRMGTASVSPGMPSSIVGTAWVMCFEIAAAMKNVKTPAGGTPTRMTTSVSGAIVAVSSVPDTTPMSVKTIAPMTPMRTAIGRSWSRSSIRRPLRPGGPPRAQPPGPRPRGTPR